MRPDRALASLAAALALAATLARAQSPLSIPGTPAPPSAAPADTDVVTLAREQLGFGQHERAIAMLAPRATSGPGVFHLWEPRVNLALGDAYRHAGRLEEAIDAYVHAAAAYGDTTVPSALRAVWRERHRTLDGLAQRLADARVLSARRVELELPRVDRPVPEFELREVARRRGWSARNTEGRLVAMVFWSDTSAAALARVAGTMALGQEERFWRVRFVSVFVPADTAAPAAEARERLRALVAARGLRFPVALDAGGAAARAFGVTTPEATVLIDRRAVFRFRNGWDTPDRRCLQAQLTELVAEASAPSSLR